MNASKIKKVFECEDFYVENLDGVINEKHFNKNYIVAPDASGVIAIDDGGNILLINEWRLKSNSFQIRIPAGRSKENETSLDCAKREFREEVGLDAEEFTLFMQYANTSSFTKQNISFFIARKLFASKLETGDELYPVEIMPTHPSQVLEFLNNGKIVGDVAAALYKYLHAFYLNA